MAISLKSLPLRPSKAPNLPIAPVEYTQGYQDQFLNTLRLYFNQVDNANGALLVKNGGSSLSFPHIAASDLTNQYADGNDTPTIVTWNYVDSISGYTLSPPGIATAQLTGVYKIDFSLELVNTDNAAHDVTVWLRINNADVPRSATSFTIPPRKSAGNPSYVCGYSTATFTIQAGDQVSLWWATDQAHKISPATDGTYILY